MTGEGEGRFYVITRLSWTTEGGGNSRRQQSAEGELLKIGRGGGSQEYYKPVVGNQVNFISTQPKSFTPPAKQLAIKNNDHSLNKFLIKFQKKIANDYV